MILFKACPRCGGDVDAARHEDVYCVQCGCRPAVVFPGPRIIESPKPRFGIDDVPVSGEACCPKCGSLEAVRLDKLRSWDNTCYRCRKCGHIFSPGRPQTRQYRTQA